MEEKQGFKGILSLVLRDKDGNIKEEKEVKFNEVNKL
jgi:hypothetical protein